MDAISAVPMQGLTPLTQPSLSLTKQQPVQKTGGDELFSDFFNAALKVYDETNASIISSEQLYIDLATGKTDDIMAVVLAQEKAMASLNFTMQVTSRVIEAYREIMRLQV